MNISLKNSSLGLLWIASFATLSLSCDGCDDEAQSSFTEPFQAERIDPDLSYSGLEHEYALYARLWDALDNGDRDEIERLLTKGENGVNPNLEFPIRSQPLICVAVTKNRFAELELLLDHGLNVDWSVECKVSNVKYKPLHLVVLSGDEGMVERLLNEGAPLHETDSKGQTVLHLARINKFGEIANLLIAKGANVNARDSAGKTPDDYVERKASEPIVKKRPKKEVGFFAKLFSYVVTPTLETKKEQECFDFYVGIDSSLTNEWVSAKDEGNMGIFRRPLKKLYKQEALKWHPDKCKVLKTEEECQNHFTQLGTCYELLMESK